MAGVSVAMAVAAGFIAAAAPSPQEPPPGPDGARLYAARCADCHGADATGVRGPDLTRLWGDGATDERVFQAIRQGVPGSIMPPSTAPDSDVRALVAYLKGLGTARPTSAAAGGGSARAGETRFWTTCGSCHRVGWRGGRLGPDLTRIGVTQAAAALRTSIRESSQTITPGYQSITLVMKDGTRLRGLRKGEDAFSVQVLDTQERLQGYAVADMTSVERTRTSLMPSYGPDRISDSELDDLVAYLVTLKGSK